ncbi:hypothetical protein QMA04_18055 [Planococcus sp. APC 3900]|uniref:hypothetical protein n=1 Tax=Planococcus sp. APC 3900 TaxID=3035191 RepID=UPI0025B4ECF0|nr:hypothetical protein [Planococcus sp. APC 3900]MDN3439997.1 hypothetical protein [Planococcus sp. APC 3900]
MIIEIEGYLIQVLLTGKKCTKQQLKQMYLQADKLTYEYFDFPDVFCRLHSFEQIPYSEDIEVDFVIDTDTGGIYTPSY